MDDHYEDVPSSFKEALLDRIDELSPFWHMLGMDLVDVKKGWAKVRLPFSEKLTNALGIAHGGAICSPADSAVGIALLGMVGKDRTITTLEMKINFIRPFTGGEITAEAGIVHMGKHTALGDVIVRDAQGRLVAKGSATYMIVDKDRFGVEGLED